jgi:hypothetical protein
MNTDNKRKCIFNPGDKLPERIEEPVEEPKKYYLDVIPYHLKDDAKENGFKFDPTNKKWYTLKEDHKLLKKYEKRFIDFDKFRKENALYYDHTQKEYYTYKDNETFYYY